MNPFKKLASQTAVYGLPTIIGRLLNYLLVPLYTYTFSPQEYGTVNEMYAYVSFLLIVLTYGMETALFNFSVKHSGSGEGQEAKDRVYSTILACVSISSGLFILFLWVFSRSIADLIQYPDHPEYVTWFALILGMDAVSSIAFARLREQNKAKTFAYVKTLNIAVNIFFNLFFLVWCRSQYEMDPQGWVRAFYFPEVGIGYIFISNVIASAVTLLVQLPSALRTRFILDASLLRPVLLYAFPLLIAGLAGMVNETIDRILLKYLLPPETALEQVGIYGACYKISIIMTLFIQTFRFAAEPFFFSHSVEKEAKPVYARVMNYFVIICMVIFLGTLFNISWIRYFIGEEYRQGLEVVPVLLMANFCLGVFFSLSIWYKLTGRTRWGAYLTLFGAAVTLAGNIIFIPRYGYMACAWTTGVCYAGMMALSFLLSNKYYQVKYDVIRFAGYVTLAVAFYFLSGLLESEGAISLIEKNALLLLFLIIVFIFERKNFHAKKNEGQDHQ